ncbi:reverse transcriptase domain-containing protein [Methylicorpusculum sp.]|uniref:reverse transcriptase domain-containing protein n=1 Tax=Methylicorpusculum sp. TaxID=2713644 RepID=UPI0027313D58|nr:reverse transcriptase domain-containing protein [Methylicorpusculum sp.]MDP2179445.1 reverse transcriptase domain-containing protein [Methylicorpusculum sp.]MDP3531450.1 reverse transcriptase domain-containing protein [Methylicorpusculum sp.]
MENSNPFLTSLALQEAFDSTFHHKLNFNDFLTLDIQKECKSFHINQKLIFNPSVTLKKYLRFLNNFVFDYAKINTEVVHSYRKGKNAYTAVEKHATSKYFFQTDINNFFNSIAIQDIEAVFDNNLVDIPILDIEQYRNNVLNLVTVDGVLPVGFSTSPSISNTCLYAFDNALECYCQSNDIVYTRYSDDIILSSKIKEALNDAKEIISEQLNVFHNGRIQLNPHKTKHTHKGKKIKLLGMVILPTGKVSVDMKVKKQLEILLHFYINDKDKFSDYLKNHYHGDLSTISGQLNYINSIDNNYLNKLRKKYGNFIIDAFFHQTIK